MSDYDTPKLRREARALLSIFAHYADPYWMAHVTMSRDAFIVRIAFLAVAAEWAATAPEARN